MNDHEIKRALGQLPGTKEPAYEVGYGKPPRQTRFKPGQSGNPRGRPRGALNQKNRIHSINQERMKLLVRQVAYRPMTVRDGDSLVEIPAIEVIIRSAVLHAAKGDRRSQQLVIGLLGDTERENKAAHTNWLETAIEYKLGLERELHRRKISGEMGPEPLPHPDDVIINFDDNDADICGPMTKEEKAQLDGLRAFIANTERIIAECEEIAAKCPDDQEIQDRLRGLRSLTAKGKAYLRDRIPRTFKLP